MSAQVTLYDLPGRCNRDERVSCFSLNPWKTRMVLNYKSVPYKTVFCEYPELAPKLREIGCPPNPPDAFAEYTSPTIHLPDGTFAADSINCAEKLETLYPEPSLHLDAHAHEPVMSAVTTAFWDTLADSMVILIREVLSEESSSWFAADRKKRLGMSLEDLSAQKGGDQMWNAARAPGGVLEKLRDSLTKHKKDPGPFVLGSQVSYGDFVAASMFECYERCDKNSYEKLINYDESFKSLHEACKPWLQRDD